MSLAERLGYTPDAKLLIVTCDDLGLTHATNVATYEALRHGMATSACPSGSMIHVPRRSIGSW